MVISEIRVPAWAANFNNERRHCWPLNDGTRRLDNIPWGSDDEEKEKCHESHEDNPKVVGKIEWLRFIHATQDLDFLSREDNPFVSDEDDAAEDARKKLQLNAQTYKVPGGDIYPYAEEYWMDGKLVFAVYLDNPNEKARIECYDENFVKVCEAAYKKVQESYE